MSRIFSQAIAAAAIKFEDALGIEIADKPLSAQDWSEPDLSGVRVAASLSELGAPQELGFLMGSATPFEFEAQARFELLAGLLLDEAARWGALDDLLIKAEAALAADRTLGGLVDWAELKDASTSPEDGPPQAAAAVALLTLTYSAQTALG